MYINPLWIKKSYFKLLLLNIMEPITTSAVATGLSSLLSTIFTNRANKRRQDDMNRYNSPAAQLDRYKKAGINPGYGQGMSSGNQSSFPEVRAPDVGAAIEPAAKFMTMKLQNQSLRNAQLENNRLAEMVRTQSLNNDFLERTLDTRVQGTKLSNTLTGSRIGQIDELRPLNIERLLLANEKQSKLMPFVAPRARVELRKLSKSVAGIDLQNALLRQKYSFQENMLPLQYQLTEQKFLQNEITNPLQYMIQKMKAFGVNPSDDLMFRMIAPGILGGQGMTGNPLYPYAIPFSLKDSTVDFWKSRKK